MRLEKPCRTQWSTFQTKPYVATYGRKPFRAWIGLEPMGMDRTRTHGRRCAEASGVFVPGKNMCFGSGNIYFGLKTMGVVVQRSPAFFPREKQCSPERKRVLWDGKHVFWPQIHGRRCAEASGGFPREKSAGPLGPPGCAASPSDAASMR